MTRLLRSAAGGVMVAAAVGASALAVGIVGARALTDTSTGALGPGVPGAIVIGEVTLDSPALVDILSPVSEAELDSEGRLPDGTPIGTAMIETMVAGADPSELESPTVGLVEVVPPAPGAGLDGGVVPQSSSPEPMGFYLPQTGSFLPDEPGAVDPCAGDTPGGEPDAGCPPGIGGTVLGAGGGTLQDGGRFVDGLLPNDGTDTTAQCPVGYPAPGSGQSGVTLLTRSYLQSAQIEYRRYPSYPGHDPRWLTLDLDPATHPGYQDQWKRLFDEQGVQVPYVARCFTLDRDVDVAYEIRGRVVDEDGHAYDIAPAILADREPGARPLTSVAMHGNEATVSVWTLAEGNVAVRSAPWPTDGDKPDCRSGAMVEGRVFTRQTPMPIGVADPDYTWRWDHRVGVMAGHSALVCITVYASDNPFDVVAEETITLYSRTAYVPSIYARELRVWKDYVRVPNLQLAVDWRCPGFTDQLWDNGNWSDTQDLLLWRCTIAHANRPIDRGGEFNVPITIRHYRTGFPIEGGPDATRYEPLEDIFAIPVEAVVCDECFRPLPGTFARALPTAEGWPEGLIYFSVEYERIPGTKPSAEETWRLDRLTIPSPPTAVDPLEVRWEHDLDLDSGTGLSTAAISLFTNRPIRVTGVRFTELGGDEHGLPCREPLGVGGPDEFTLDGAASITTVFEINGLCPGLTYDVVVTAIDEEGRVRTLSTWEADELIRVPPLGGAFDVVVEFLTEEQPHLVITDLEVRIDNRRLDVARLSAGLRRSVPSCLAIEDGVATLVSVSPSGDVGPFGRSIQILYARGASLSVWISFANPRVGDTCEDPSPHPGPFTVSVGIPIGSLNGASANPGVGGSAGALADAIVVERTLDRDLTVRLTIRPHPLGTTWVLREDDGFLLGP